MKMKLSESGYKLLKELEGNKKNSQGLHIPYLCAAGVPTIGYGNTFYENGNKVTLKDLPITELKATKLLEHIVDIFENCLNNVIKSKINQNQFDALLCFCFNVGITAFTNSTLLKKVNINPFDTIIKDEFVKWCKAKVPAIDKKGNIIYREGKTIIKTIIIPGLLNRREKEIARYFLK